MKIKELFAAVLKALRIAAGWIILVFGGLLAGICALCAILALFGGLETESFGEQLGLSAIFLILMCVGICVLIWGRWIKNGMFGRKQEKTTAQRTPRVLTATHSKLPQPSEDQRKLEQIERNIDSVVGAIQANPMSPVRPADEELLKKLQQEKRARLKRIAAHSEKITVRDAWKTFTPEQQKRFDAQVYQYSQDVGRGGLEPEIAAANRGLAFVDGKPVPKEVAARLDELQKAAAVPAGRFKARERREARDEKTLTFQPALSTDLKGYRMDMHTTSGEKYSFVLSGLAAFHPNRSSMCGYGCDDWLFHCSVGNEDYILNFSDEASYGRCWSCTAISREDAAGLDRMEAADWLRVMAAMAKSGKQILHLHPDHAAEARATMAIHSSRCGPISDADFYGL